MASLTLVVMAAGIGSRYGGLKQIEPVGPSGEVVLDYSVYDALRAGFDRVVFIIRRDIERDFREKIGRRIERAAETAYAIQSLDALPWGTAHAILCARTSVATPFLAINADDYYGRTAFASVADFLGRGSGGDGGTEFAMVGYRLANTLSEHGTVARGVCTATADGHLVGIRELLKIRRFPDGIMHTENDVEWTPLAPDSWTSMNCWGFAPALFAELERRFPEFLRARAADITRAEFLIPEVVGDLIREKRARVKILPTRERWFGVTYPEDGPAFRKAILELIEAGVYPRDLWAGTPKD
jgi:hypothetical protein